MNSLRSPYAQFTLNSLLPITAAMCRLPRSRIIRRLLAWAEFGIAIRRYL